LLAFDEQAQGSKEQGSKADHQPTNKCCAQSCCPCLIGCLLVWLLPLIRQALKEHACLLAGLLASSFAKHLKSKHADKQVAKALKEFACLLAGLLASFYLLNT
jgi:hypothetical protein